MNMEKYFSEKKGSLKEVYQVFKNTTYGKKLNLPDWNVNSYEEFKRLPVLNSKECNFEDLLIPTDGLWMFKTSGVSGNIKTIYRDIGTIVGYPKEMDETLRSNDTLFLHSKRRKGESYYETHDFNHKRMYPNGIIGEYETKEQLLEYIQRGNVLFIIEYPLMAEWICYQLKKAIKTKELPKNKLVKKKVYLELSGEPVTERRVNSIIKRMEKIFQCEIEYFITYGSNEIGHIGTYIPTLHGSQIIYEVIPSLFVEEIDDEIIITPFRTKGTILFRYKQGDKGRLLFKNGKPFLKVFGKSIEEGTLYIAGAQINFQDLMHSLKRFVKFPIGLTVVKKENLQKGICKIEICVHTFQNLNNDLKNIISDFIRSFIMDSAYLQVENRLGIIKTIIQYSNTPLKKQLIIQNGGDGNE